MLNNININEYQNSWFEGKRVEDEVIHCEILSMFYLTSLQVTSF